MHYHFFEVNDALTFDRLTTHDIRLNIAAGTAARFEPGQSHEVELVEIGGGRRVYDFVGWVMGDLQDPFPAGQVREKIANTDSHQRSVR